MRVRNKFKVLAGGILSLLIGACLLAGCGPTSSDTEQPAPAPAPVPAPAPSTSVIPEKVSTVLHYIDKHHEAPPGYEGGRVFHNHGGQNEQALPKHDGQGQQITYHEWDVHAKVAGVNRGAERLITGSDGSAYYTADHYRTFTKVR